VLGVSCENVGVLKPATNIELAIIFCMIDCLLRRPRIMSE